MTDTTRSTRTLSEGNRSTADNESVSLAPVEPGADSANLYSMTPPVYTQSIADGELTVDAEATGEEKLEVIDRLPERLTPPHDSLQQHASIAIESPAVTQQQTQEVERDDSAQRCSPTTYTATTTPPALSHYLTEPVATANLVGVSACSILHDRPAIWLVKRTTMALSPLAAAVLTKEGLVKPKDLKLISQYSGARRDPMDPISGLLLGFYDCIGEMTLGLVAGPVELGRQASPMLARYKSRQKEDHDVITRPVTVNDLKSGPRVAAQVAIGAGKGLGRVVTANLKLPMLAMHGLTRGFHNLPKLYGEEVRQYENVTGLRSGLLVSAQSFGYGLGDGLRDLFAKPIEGAQESGIIGFGTGLAKGFGNAVSKPAAGTCGLIGYSFVGVYKSIRTLHYPRNEDPAVLVHKLGAIEYEQANDAVKLHVVRVWCQTQMRVRLG